MRKLNRVMAAALCGVMSSAFIAPAVHAQEAQDAQTTDDQSNFDDQEIVVTAQRTSERLQDVPIAVSAFSAESLERQQIKNTSDLQATLPNVTFTKTNFTGSSFTIRGIGDLCVGVTCDSATAIHMNDAPLFSTRLFEGEFYDLGQIEVLRGPQGTLYGRNATSGVVNIRTARPELGAFGAAGEAEYGNYDSIKVKGMINLPVGDVLGVRLAGFYLNRDGYTQNIYNNTRLDNRDMYGGRASVRFEPSDSTTIDLMAQYFHEDDNRLRIQKQKCQRDPTGILGCLNGVQDYGTTNANATLGSIFASKEFFAIRGITAGVGGLPFYLGSLYAPDAYAGVVNPADPRIVNTDYTPTYRAEEWIAQGSIEQELGGGLKAKLSGNYQEVKVDSSQDYNLSVQNRAGFATALTTLQNAASGAYGAALQTYLRPIANALIPGGATGQLCTSSSDPTMVGVWGGNKVCASTPQDFDRSVQTQSSWTAEGIISSDWEGKFNFLLGGIYGKLHMTENSYYVNAFGLDYAGGILGAISALGAGLPATATQSYALASFYRNNSDDLKVETYGIFGEGYFNFADNVKLTVGVRYNHDKKEVKARTSLFTDAVGGSIIVPTGSPITSAVGYANLDFDPGRAGVQEYAIRQASSGEWTGRAVLDWNITDDNLLYASYSRGYKSGGINPPLSAGFAVPETFVPEFVDAFEVGSKNTFGALQLNLTGFYYKYKDLQLSRIVNRTSVNDNVSANIYGLEAEAVIRPTREFTVNLGASYLHTEVSQDKFLANPHDFGAGRADAVIIKDITNASNCAVRSTSGSVAGVNGYVNQMNNLINAGAIAGVAAGANLQGTTAFPSNGGIASTGAYSICAVLDAAKSTVGASFGGIAVDLAGITTNIKGNSLPGAPSVKFSAGAQYAAPIGNMTLTPRIDVAMTGESTGSVFNGVANSIDSYWQANASVQLEGPDRRWYLRAFVQNMFDQDAVTGQYVTDQSSGLYTNVFTLEPRRFGVAAGFKF